MPRVRTAWANSPRAWELKAAAISEIHLAVMCQEGVIVREGLLADTGDHPAGRGSGRGLLQVPHGEVVVLVPAPFRRRLSRDTSARPGSPPRSSTAW
jgi:hypothetical protein